MKRNKNRSRAGSDHSFRLRKELQSIISMSASGVSGLAADEEARRMIHAIFHILGIHSFELLPVFLL